MYTFPSGSKYATDSGPRHSVTSWSCSVVKSPETPWNPPASAAAPPPNDRRQTPAILWQASPPAPAQLDAALAPREAVGAKMMAKMIAFMYYDPSGCCISRVSWYLVYSFQSREL